MSLRVIKSEKISFICSKGAAEDGARSEEIEEAEDEAVEVHKMEENLDHTFTQHAGGQHLLGQMESLSCIRLRCNFQRSSDGAMGRYRHGMDPFGSGCGCVTWFVSGT
eukprot:scaffold20905_cov200-Skeletonema_marinoi.AAC.2